MGKSAEITAISKILHDARHFFQSAQNPDGGFPYNDVGSPSGAWTTSGVIWALLSAGASASDKCISDAFAYLIAHQNDDGLIPITKRGDVSCIDATAQFILAAELVGIERDVALREASAKAVSGLCSAAHNSHWGTLVNTQPVVTSTASALIALHAARNAPDDEAIRDTVLAGVGWLLNIRNADHGWGIYEGNSSKAAPTAFALSAIQACLPNELANKKQLISEGQEFLLNRQHDDGHWDDLIERSAGLTVIRLSTPYCLSSLASTGCSINDVRLQKALLWLIRHFDKGRLPYQDSDIVTWSTRDGLIALAAVREHILEHQLLDVFDMNVKLENARCKALGERDAARQAFDSYRQQEDTRVKTAISDKLSRISTAHFILKIAVVVLLLLLLGASLAICRSIVSLTRGELFVLSGILVAVWAGVVKVLFSRGVPE